jgi:multidrug resistance efflux pump
MKKVIKWVILIVILAVVACGAVFGALHYRKTKLTAEVSSVEDLKDWYSGDEVSSYGQVTNDYSQTVYLSSQDTIKEVYVEEGQEVTAGDKLFAYDVTSSELNYNMKVLDVEKLENQIQIAQNDLKKLKNTTPVTIQEPTQSQPDQAEPEPEEEIPQMDGNAYRYITEDSIPYNQDEADGSTESPYRYLCTEEAYVTGETLAEIAQSGICVIFEIYENNDVNGTLLYQWEIDGNKAMAPEAGTKWDIETRTQISETVDDTQDADTGMDEDVTEEETSIDFSVGYTAEELKQMIADKEQELKDLDLSKRKAELEVQKLEQNTSDGIVYATVTGTVKNLQDPDNLPSDGTPFLEVSGSEGLYVTGALSELLLDQVSVGQTLEIYSWESGISCEGTITEIFDYPVSDANAYGDGNQNVSYYPYTAYIEDTSGLRNGEYVDMTMTVGADDDGEILYLPKAYVRTENGLSYVYKADENDRLVKQYVQTGAIRYGYSIEIKSGLATDDRIAFPYGKTAKEGVRVVDSDGEM